MKKYLLLLFALTSFVHTEAQDLQEAPTLQVGLSGITFSKGNLDPQLIAEIISEKQKEIKVKLIKNMLLNNLGVDNGLFYAYIDHSIEIITNEKDENTRVKNMLENTINLAFVVGYADYYIGTLRPNTKEWNSFKSLAISYGIEPLIFDKSKLNLKDFAKINYRKASNDKIVINDNKSEIDKIKSINKFVGVIIDLFAEQIRQNEKFKSLGLLRTNYLQNYISMNSYLSLENEKYNTDAQDYVKQLDSLYDLLNGKSNIEIITLIQKMEDDLKKDVITNLKETEKENLSEFINKINEMTERIVKKGFYNKIQGNEVANYVRIVNNNENSFYLNHFKNRKYKIHKIRSGGIASSEELFINEILINYRKAVSKYELYNNALLKRDLADTIFNEVNKNLSVYVKYFGLIKSLVDKGENWKESLNIISNNFKCGEFKSLNTKMLSHYDKARTEIKDLNKLNNDEVESLEKLNSFIERIKYVELNRFEYIKTYETEIKPSLNRLGIYSRDFIEMGNTLYTMLNCIDTSIRNELAEVNIDLKMSFMNVFTKIDEFDKVETYSCFLNQLSDAGDVFSDDEMRKSINRIITIVRSYIKINNEINGKLSVNLDIEGFLYNLQNTPYNKFRPLQFNFTVGANTALFNNNFISNNKDTIRNYSYIGEKLGLKFKIWDWKYIHSFSKGETFTYKHLYNFFRNNKLKYLRTSPPKETTVSNIHLLAYGTGILYNLINTGTSKNFNSPLLGFGVGITFFNNLDFNVSWGKPILINKSINDSSVPSFFNVGFDIQFIEYYDRLNQKRKANQIQKKIAQAVKYHY